jgi:type II secretory pathway pseudopilin PulG
MQVKRNFGFSIVEIIIVIVISGLLFGAVAMIFTEFTKAFQKQKEISAVHDSTLVHVDQMTREIRAMTSIVSASASALRFINADSVDVSYQLSSNNITRIDYTNGRTDILTNNISALTFTYYDMAGAVTAVLADIKYFNLDLTVSYTGGAYNFTTTVFKRN